MIKIATNRIASAARTAVVASLIGAGAAGLVGLAGTANAAPAAPLPTGTSGSLYGDPGAAAPYWRKQNYDDCGLMAVADVVGQLKRNEPTEAAIIALAQQTPSKSHPGSVYIKPSNLSDPNSGQGVWAPDEALMLAQYGIHGKVTDNRLSATRGGIPTGMAALEQYLAGGHKVIAGVNAELIWRKPVETKTRDGKPAADHALVVTGVDTKTNTVHLNDSGTKKGRDEQVSIDLFQAAWAASGEEMVVTQETA